jgi:hypothetical protein
MEIFRAFVIGALAGAIYVWPFAASKSYKLLVLSGVRHGRAIALMTKIISLIVGLVVFLGSIIVVRRFSSKSLAAIDFCLFLATAVASGCLAWRFFYNPRISPPS